MFFKGKAKRKRKRIGNLKSFQGSKPEAVEADDFDSVEAIFAEIENLSADPAKREDPAVAARILQLRHWAGARLAGKSRKPSPYPKPEYSNLPEPGLVPETTLAEATPEMIRGALLQNGCLLIRGVVPREVAEGLATDIERAYEIRTAVSEDRANGESKGWYEEFSPDSPYFSTVDRGWIGGGGGLLAADSPVMHAKMLAAFTEAGLSDLIAGYLGEPAAISDQKCTLRKTPPSAGRGWHQDGSFMGEVKALNVWMALTHCGDTAPGMDIVPKRIDEILPSGTEGTEISIQIHEDIARGAAGEGGVVRPIFEPGDVLLFDEMFLHTTAADAAMPNTRYAIESWFFGASAFPEDYVPIAA